MQLKLQSLLGKVATRIELDVLKDMNEGLITVLDRMINDCLNRSDGLAELMESMNRKATVSSSACSRT